MAQSYIPMLGQTNEWRIVSCNNGCSTDAYFALGDTLVDGNNYKVLDGFHYIEGNFLIREDIQQEKVFMKVLDDHSLLDEFPLYDFSIDDGDTVDVYNPISPLPENGGKFVLDSIISRPLENGNHRFFYLHAANPSASLSENTVWVEGVGSLTLINSPGAYPTGDNHMGCAFKDDQLVYSNTDSIFSCGALGVTEINKIGNLKVFPNPTKGMIAVQFNGMYSFELTDISGKVVYQGNGIGHAEIDISELHAGIYMLTALSEENQSVTKVLKY